MNEHHYCTVQVVGTFDDSNEQGGEAVSVEYINTENGSLYLGPPDNQYILEFEFETA